MRSQLCTAFRIKSRLFITTQYKCKTPRFPKPARPPAFPALLPLPHLPPATGAFCQFSCSSSSFLTRRPPHAIPSAKKNSSLCLQSCPCPTLQSKNESTALFFWCTLVLPSVIYGIKCLFACVFCVSPLPMAGLRSM